MPFLAFPLNDGNDFLFEIAGPRVTLGRDPRNDMVVDHRSIALFHAEFIGQPEGGYALVDLQSETGTFVNGKRETSKVVRAGDRLQFGSLAARLLDRAP